MSVLSDTHLNFDVVIVGGGLQGALLALCLRHFRPSARVAVVERSRRLGGNHLWSFHAGDVPEAARVLVEPLVVARWPAYDVAFPDHARRIDEPYASISSDRLHLVASRCGADLFFHAEAARIDAGEVALTDGRVLHAALVIDARGPQKGAAGCAYQKFCGVELETAGPAVPMLMDARVEQRDGFRFVYVLPLAERRVLVEETRFSLNPSLDGLEEAALDYARTNGLSGPVLRREQGVLPLPLDPPEPSTAAPLKAGYGGGFFHPTTGYSFPPALRLALSVARGEPIDVAALRTQQRFAVLLNRLLFRAVGEADRWSVLSRFHRLPPGVIRRFYALETTRSDRARILCGRPPRGVSLRKALEVLTA